MKIYDKKRFWSGLDVYKRQEMETSSNALTRFGPWPYCLVRCDAVKISMVSPSFLWFQR